MEIVKPGDAISSPSARLTRRSPRNSAAYRRIYAFLSQITPRQKADLGKLYTFGCFLQEIAFRELAQRIYDDIRGEAA